MAKQKVTKKPAKKPAQPAAKKATKPKKPAAKIIPYTRPAEAAPVAPHEVVRLTLAEWQEWRGDKPLMRERYAPAVALLEAYGHGLCVPTPRAVPVLNTFREALAPKVESGPRPELADPANPWVPTDDPSFAPVAAFLRGEPQSDHIAHASWTANGKVWEYEHTWPNPRECSEAVAAQAEPATGSAPAEDAAEVDRRGYALPERIEREAAPEPEPEPLPVVPTVSAAESLEDQLAAELEADDEANRPADVELARGEPEAVAEFEREAAERERAAEVAEGEPVEI